MKFLAIAVASGLLCARARAATTTSWRAIPTIPSSALLGRNLVANLDDPKAKDAQKVCLGYTATDVRNEEGVLSARLVLEGDGCGVYGTDIRELDLRVHFSSKTSLNLRILPAVLPKEQESWYDVKEEFLSRVSYDQCVDPDDTELDFQLAKSPFAFTVVRKRTGDVLFSTEGSRLVFENQFIEFRTRLPPKYNIYGLGDVMHGFKLGNHYNRTFYATDANDPLDENLYGMHPFYLEHRYKTSSDNLTKGYAHGVYLRNVHGQEVLLRDESLTWRTIGGIVDLTFYSGPTPASVIADYTRTVGLPAMQQYWTFGFHQCRWGYSNVSNLVDVVKTYKEFNIPLETIWSDIDYMNQFRDFTSDPVSYEPMEFSAFLKELHASGQRYVPIVDAAIYVPNPENASDAYPIYNNGLAANAYIKNPDGSLYIGAVWPGFTVFPDWSAPGTQGWWTDAFVNWHKEVAYDGIWLDMNEVSSFCVGSCGSKNVTQNPVHPPFALPGEKGNLVLDYPEGFSSNNATEAARAALAQASQDAYNMQNGPSAASVPPFLSKVTPGLRDNNYPPYVINNFQEGHDLAVHAVSPNATHSDGSLEYDLHNLWGHLESKATYQALLKVFPNKRPFIISRSTAPGTGAWAGHWGGDNASKWVYMVLSIPQALSFSMFGMPMFGVDTCGFGGNTDMELCSRWMQLSAFFPFYRNHNILSARPQEAYRWEAVASASRIAMNIRYSLLPYMYTLFHHAHTTGATVMRALSWEFPDDPSLVDIDRQFLLGPGIMVAPVLDRGANFTNASFPGGKEQKWYDWYNQTAVLGSEGRLVNIDAPLGHIPVYIRGGVVLALQRPAYTTSLSRGNPWDLIVALSSAGEAYGDLYLDDGESITPESTGFVTFRASNRHLGVFKKGHWTPSQPLSSIAILGVQEKPRQVLFGKHLSGTWERVISGQSVFGRRTFDSWEWDWKTQVLKVTGLEAATERGVWARDWELIWE